MPQTFTQLHYHLVFSTKHRQPTLTPDIRERVWEYLGGIVRGEGGQSILVGGTADHVHMLASLPQTQSLADVVRKVKGGSSTWAHATFPGCGLWWQTGYGAFTVSHSAVEAVREYIAQQEERHRKWSFQDEFRSLLRKHGLEPDEVHMWD
jgi:putative transposase